MNSMQRHCRHRCPNHSEEWQASELRRGIRGPGRALDDVRVRGEGGYIARASPASTDCPQGFSAADRVPSYPGWCCPTSPSCQSRASRWLAAVATRGPSPPRVPRRPCFVNPSTRLVSTDKVARDLLSDSSSSTAPAPSIYPSRPSQKVRLRLRAVFTYLEANLPYDQALRIPLHPAKW